MATQKRITCIWLQVIFVEGYKVPLMIQKTDGGFGYGTTDMAAIRQRLHEEKGDLVVYVTDSGQASHFELVFGAATKAGFLPKDGSVRVDHVGFGVVLNEDGSRIKTRAGEVRPDTALEPPTPSATAFPMLLPRRPLVCCLIKARECLLWNMNFG